MMQGNRCPLMQTGYSWTPHTSVNQIISTLVDLRSQTTMLNIL